MAICLAAGCCHLLRRVLVSYSSQFLQHRFIFYPPIKDSPEGQRLFPSSPASRAAVQNTLDSVVFSGASIASCGEDHPQNMQAVPTIVLTSCLFGHKTAIVTP
jgi:hypothetical protein